MSKIVKKMKIMQPGGTLSDYVPIGAEAENINVDGESVETKLGKKPYYYNIVADMKADMKLKAGDMVITLGFHTKNDNGGARYKIRNITNDDVVDEMTIIALNNQNLIAELIIDELINVKQFGAYGDNTHDDTNAFQGAINYIRNKEISFASNTGDGNIYTGLDYKLIIPYGRYKITTVNINLNYIDICGEKAIIQSNAIPFNITAGFKINIEGLKFIECTDAIKIDGSNQETGRLDINNCEFINCSSHAIYIPFKQSYIGLIQNCTFFKCYYVLEENNCDLMILRNCWISERKRTIDYDASILINGSELQVDGCLFVPTGTTALEPAYIKGGTRITVLNSHFGGETGSKAIIRVDTSTNNGSYIIDNCQFLHSIKNNATIMLANGFQFIAIKNCRGMADYTTPIRWSALATQEIQDTFINAIPITQSRIYIENTEMDRTQKQFRRTFVPANLVNFVNDDYNSIKYFKQAYNYSLDETGNTLTIIPFGGTNNNNSVNFSLNIIKCLLSIKNPNNNRIYEELVYLIPGTLGDTTSYTIVPMGGIDSSNFSVTTTGKYFNTSYTIVLTSTFKIENVRLIENENLFNRNQYSMLG